ncbi:MAG: exosortase system-associated protein, TIGR04073 family [Candidatus Omnitrophica bacterium]|nr:exosortase system-associated protein, TIGR04073 family [Candidatus Omnitrophota bacterium]
MKRMILAGLSFIAIMFIAAPLYCQEKVQDDKQQEAAVDTDDMHYEKTPINKLGRGLLNTATCFLEIPASMYKVSEEKDEIAGWTLGVGQGFLTSFLRLFSGVFDTVTFLIPPYNKPFMSPEYPWQSFEDGYKERLSY